MRLRGLRPRRGFRFVALDNNYHRGADGKLKHYADESVWAKCHQDEMAVPPEQVEFLRDAIATAIMPSPVCRGAPYPPTISIFRKNSPDLRRGRSSCCRFLSVDSSSATWM